MIEQGLGKYDEIVNIEIHWPGQEKPQVISQLSPNTKYLITQGQAKATEIKMKKVDFDTSHQHHHHH